MMVLRTGIVGLGLVVVVIAACGSGDEIPESLPGGDGSTADPSPVVSPIDQDETCSIVAVVPTISVTGDDDLDPVSWQVEGTVEAIDVSDDAMDIFVGRGDRSIGLTVQHSGVDRIDLAPGRHVSIDFRRNQGFEGEARGLRIVDDDGVVILVEDGDYGNALPSDLLSPFAFEQVDIGCRNRANEPTSLNNFSLSVTADEATIDVMPGGRATLDVGGSDYDVHALRSTSRHSGVEWTDAPYSFTSFAIARLP